MPPPEMWQQAKQNSSTRKQSIYDHGQKGRDSKTEGQQKQFRGSRSSFCGRGSIVGRGSTHCVVGLVSCYPVCHLLPALSAACSLRPLPSPLPIPLDATRDMSPITGLGRAPYYVSPHRRAKHE